MTLESFVAFDFAAAGHTESFGRGSIGFDFWHFLLLRLTLSKILGRLFRRQQHRHASAFQARFDVDLGDILHLIDDTPKHLPAQFWVRDFPAAKKNRDFDPLAFADELTNVADLVLDVVRVGARTHFDFFDFDNRMFFRPMGLFFLLVAKFAVIHHAAYRRLRVGSDFDQIKLLRLHLFERFMKRQHAQLLALRSDHPHFAGANLMIDPRFSSYRPPPSSI
jgi:hypothetical protein